MKRTGHPVFVVDGNLVTDTSITLTGDDVTDPPVPLSRTGLNPCSQTTWGVYNVTPVARPSAYTLTYSTATRTHAAITAVAPASTAATNVAPYGFSQTQADAIKNACINLITDVANVKQVLNQVITDLKNQGHLQ